MGNWHISIQGVGSHHNQDNSTDANRMARRFVRELKKAGHNVAEATFTHGAAERLDEGVSSPEYINQGPAEVDHE